MSSNMNPSTPTNDSTKVAANAPPAARLKWDDLDGIRTLLFVLYKRYAYAGPLPRHRKQLWTDDLLAGTGMLPSTPKSSTPSASSA